MTRDETIALFERCEAARKAALAEGKNEFEAHDAAKAVWNGWAESMLTERKALEDAGKWATKKRRHGILEPKNDATRAWMNSAQADFSHTRFRIGTSTQQEEPGGVA